VRAFGERGWATAAQIMKSTTVTSASPMPLIAGRTHSEKSAARRIVASLGMKKRQVRRTSAFNAFMGEKMDGSSISVRRNFYYYFPKLIQV